MRVKDDCSRLGDLLTADIEGGTGSTGEEDICSLLIRAFIEAYPDTPEETAEHMARNYAQVIEGIVEFGRRMGRFTPVTHAEVAHSIMFWCIEGSRLQEYISEDGQEPEASGLSPAQIYAMLEEFSDRITHWLVGAEAMRTRPGLFEDFVRGTVAMEDPQAHGLSLAD